MSTVVEDSPELGEMSIAPYPYQVDAFNAALKQFKTVRSTLVVMPTGTGKTETALFVARCVIEEGGRALFLAHTDELVQQPRNKAIPVGLTAAVEKADNHACPHFTLADGTGSLYGTDDPKLVVASVQTLQGKRLAKWPRGHFDLIVCDEAHRAVSVSWKNVIDHFQPRMVLGVTATAVRGDGEPVVGRNQAFETLAFKYPITDAVGGGWLVRPRFGCMDLDIDLGNLRVKGAADLNEKDIDELLLPHITEIANELREKLEGRRAIIFTPMVCSAQRLAWAMQGLGVSTEWISGESKDRPTVISEFKSGRYQHLVNAMVLTEGFDARFVDTVVLLRATKSWGLFVQMAGRCLRTFPGKADGLILGVNWRNFQNLVHPVDILCDSETPPEVRDEAKRAVDSGEEADLFAALKKGRAEHERREQVRNFRVREHAARARVEYADALGFDPDFVAPTPDFKPASWDLPPTEKQVDLLLKLRWKPADFANWSRARATEEIGRELGRVKRGLATHRMVKTLKSFRVPGADEMTRTEASARLDELLGARR